MNLAPNAFKSRMKAGELQIGLWCSLCSNIAAELVADSGFDWLLLDTEHSPNELPDILSYLQAVQGRASHPVVRAAWNDTVLIKRFLDIGAQTILLPYEQNAEEARRYIGWGYTFVAVGTDLVLLARAADGLAQRFKA